MRESFEDSHVPGNLQIFGVIPIEEVQFNEHARDAVTKVLIGLQEIYKNYELRTNIIELLRENEDIEDPSGRKGMPLWTIFVLGVLRLTCNWSYDFLCDQLSNHKNIRGVIGLTGILYENKTYSRTTINENMKLFDSATSDKVNTLVVKFGQKEIVGNGTAPKQINAMCDSYVLHTNVHFPTDLNLLLDAVTSLINIASCQATLYSIAGWRNHASIYQTIRQTYNTLSKMRPSNSTNENQKLKRLKEIKSSTQGYLQRCKNIRDKVQECMNEFGFFASSECVKYIEYIDTLTDQIKRRVIQEQKIASTEKIFSLYEPHTEWICKGKAGVRQELGVKFGVVIDQYNFVLYSDMMYKQQDKDVAFDFAKSTQERFSGLTSMSFDKGYHTKSEGDILSNAEKITALGVQCTLPKKGKRNKQEDIIEKSPEFGKARKQHPAVESGIHAIQVHGLKRCPDKGIQHFDSYAHLGILAYNIHNIGKIVLEKAAEKRRQKAA